MSLTSSINNINNIQQAFVQQTVQQTFNPQTFLATSTLLSLLHTQGNEKNNEIKNHVKSDNSRIKRRITDGSTKKAARKERREKARAKRAAISTTQNIEASVSSDYKVTYYKNSSTKIIDIKNDIDLLNSGSIGKFAQPVINGYAIQTKVNNNYVIDMPMSLILTDSKTTYNLQFVLRINPSNNINPNNLIYVGPTKAGTNAYLTGNLDGRGDNGSRSTIIYPTTIGDKDILLPIGYYSSDRMDHGTNECMDVQATFSSAGKTITDRTILPADFIQALYRDENLYVKQIINSQINDKSEPLDCLHQAQIQGNGAPGGGGVMPDIYHIINEWSTRNKKRLDSSSSHFKLNDARLTRIEEDLNHLPDYRNLEITNSSHPIINSNGYMTIEYTDKKSNETYIQEIKLIKYGGSYRFNVSPQTAVKITTTEKPTTIATTTEELTTTTTKKPTTISTTTEEPTTTTTTTTTEKPTTIATTTEELTTTTTTTTKPTTISTTTEEPTTTTTKKPTTVSTTTEEPTTTTISTTAKKITTSPKVTTKKIDNRITTIAKKPIVTTNIKKVTTTFIVADYSKIITTPRNLNGTADSSVDENKILNSTSIAGMAGGLILLTVAVVGTFICIKLKKRSNQISCKTNICNDSADVDNSYSIISRENVELFAANPSNRYSSATKMTETKAKSLGIESVMTIDEATV